MYILGISAYYHDSAAVLLNNDNIIAAVQEERFTRKKHDPSFPTQAIKYCLEDQGLTIDDLDIIIFYDKPFLKFERLLETYYNYAPRGLLSYLKAIPIWAKEKLFMKKMIYNELLKISSYNKQKVKLLFSEHHLSHAASAFYPSPYEEAAILTIDGVGEWATTSIALGSGSKIKILRELHFPHSLGLLYSAFTYFCGFKVNSGEYKLMGLAPYGNENSKFFQDYYRKIKDELITIYSDGSIWPDQQYFNYTVGLSMINDKKFEKLFDLKRRRPESPLLQEYCDMALAIQRVTEEIILKMARYTKEITNAKYLCLAGGVALNCVANGKLLESQIFKDIWIQPAAGDAGGALGAAYGAYHLYLQNERKIKKTENETENIDKMNGAYLGPEFSKQDILRTSRKHKAKFKYYDNFNELAEMVAHYLDDGNVIGWYQGRMEWGPRALGNRSILGDPRAQDMQKKLNLKIKYRESFRPFAPSVQNEHCLRYFKLEKSSPYMLQVSTVSDDKRNALPQNFYEMPLRDKLYYSRSTIPAITHLDYSARIQTVHKETNPRYWSLIEEFRKKTGLSVIVNTSFNVRGEPIVCTPEDAYRCFMRTEMDYLVCNNFIFSKKDQPKLFESKDWKNEYELD